MGSQIILIISLSFALRLNGLSEAVPIIVVPSNNSIIWLRSSTVAMYLISPELEAVSLFSVNVICLLIIFSPSFAWIIYTSLVGYSFCFPIRNFKILACILRYAPDSKIVTIAVQSIKRFFRYQ
ncbi:hypothetical protein MEC_00099 [Bartonella alsatica IBS 382]|uniref:Uncharacterized protein n=1 Tax=Bartonella alsatica IBS 382 TaxID=1094551 RepID=J1IXM7_9HYPH|nr:hypothetical protein MEC_00099 [Bartonella alsatica IBS 382]